MSDSPSGQKPREAGAVRPAREDFGRLYHQAFRDFGALALWNLREIEQPTPREALAITRQLRTQGNMASRRLAEALEQACRAHL